MTHTYREIVYAILDEAKVISDDTLLENEHLIYIANKYRALLFNQKYKGKKIEIPFAWYQRLNVNFTYPSIGSNIYKSTKQIPKILDTTNLWQYTFISTKGINTPNLNFINPQRFKICGYNKWTGNELYGTIDLDNYMYLKSKNDKYIDISQKETGTITKSIKYGRLYNAYTISDLRGVAPTGWHIPTKEEADIFVAYVSANTTILDYLNLNNWNINLGGIRIGSNFSNINIQGFYFTSTQQINTNDKWVVLLSPQNINSNCGWNSMFGASLRCIRDSNNTSNTAVDADGNIYLSTTIGTQTWLKDNLVTTHYNNGDLIDGVFGGTDGAVSAYNNDENNVYEIIDTTTLVPFINGSILYDTILDNPIDADRFNDVNTLDILDLEFPCEESLIQPIIDLCLKEIGAINNITRDITNNASDDASLPKQQ